MADTNSIQVPNYEIITIGEKGAICFMDDDTKRDESVEKKSTADPLEYEPSRTEQALLDVLLDPFHRMSTVTKICEILSISRQTFYRTMRKPEFAAHYSAICKEAVRIKTGQLVNIGIREARKGGKGSYGYWKDLMKMSGMIEDEKMQLEGEVVHKIMFVDPEDD